MIRKIKLAIGLLGALLAITATPALSLAALNHNETLLRD